MSLGRRRSKARKRRQRSGALPMWSIVLSVGIVVVGVGLPILAVIVRRRD